MTPEILHYFKFNTNLLANVIAFETSTVYLANDSIFHLKELLTDH